jgi:hypothetical protein
VANKKNNHRFHLGKKTIGITLVVIILFASAAFGYFLWYKHVNTQTSSSSQQPTDAVAQKQAQVVAKVQATDDQASKAAIAGDTKAGLQTYDTAIAQSSDDQESRQLYLTKAAFALNNSSFDEALSAALAADKIQSTDTSLSAAAKAYNGKHDVTTTALYYNKAADYVAAQPNRDSGNSAAYYRYLAQQAGKTQ